MARTLITQEFELRQQYLSQIYHAFPGGSWTLLNQGRALSPNQSSNESEYGRIGSQNRKKVAQSVTTDVNVQVYVEDNLKEVALVMGGNVRPGGGWLGSEIIQLDTTMAHNFKIENYDGITSSATLLSTEYVNSWRPSGVGAVLESEGDVRIFDFPGSADSYYIIPAAGA